MIAGAPVEGTSVDVIRNQTSSRDVEKVRGAECNMSAKSFFCRRRFAAISVAALLFGLPGLALSATGVALADQFLPAGGAWQTYVNDRFGMRFDFPSDVFAPGEPAENRDGQGFESADAALQIFAFHNVDQESPDLLKRRIVAASGYEHVTYSAAGTNWQVISGFRGDRIFYEKYFFRDGMIYAFGMEFPAERKPFYAPIIERIEDSFRAGRSD